MRNCATIDAIVKTTRRRWIASKVLGTATAIIFITVACSGTGRDDDTGAASPTVTVDPEPVSEVTVAADQAATLQFSDQVTVIVPPSAVSPDSVITLHQVSGVPAGAGPLTSAGSPVDIQLDNGAQTGDVLIQYRLSPTAEVLGQPVGAYYDLATGEWAEVPSTYDPATRVVTLTTSHLSIFDVFYWPIDKVSDAAAGVWNWATADVFKNVDSPTCENDAHSGAGTASDRWQWASSNGPRILWCIGTDGAGDFVKLASGYRNPITVTWNAGFSRRSFSTTGGGLARELSDAIERALLPKPTEGGIAILDRGEQITLQLNGGRSAYLRTDFDHFAQIVDISLAGFSYISAAAGAGRGDLSKVLGSDPGLRQQIVDGLQKGDCLASAANQPEGTRLSVDQGSEIASRLVAECFPDDVAAEVAKRLGASVTFWDRIVSTIGGFLNGLRDLVVKGVGGYLTGLWDMGAGSDRYEMRLDPITPPHQADTGQDQQQEQGQQQEQTQQQSGGEQQAPPLALTFSFAENPFVCDGPSRPFGRLYGATPGERITFTSPDVGDLLPGTADGHGELGLIWQCNPNEAGRTWTVTASGSSSGRKGTFSVTGAAPLGGDGTQSETWPETTGGVTHTWSDWTNAGGVEGPTIPAVTTVQIACKLPGFRVADGNTWWYRIASSPWNGQFYASADPFYNNGATSGPLLGTPFVDSAVRDC